MLSKKKFFKPMTPEQLKRNNRFWLIILAAAAFFLLRDFYLSAIKDIPQIGFRSYVTGPIFTHKISEILLLLLWMPAAWMSNYERSGIWPAQMPPDRYLRLLKWLSVTAVAQISLAVYSWTIINLGTSPLTTNFEPLVLGQDSLIWRYYPAILTVAGMAFIPFANRKIDQLARLLATRVGAGG